MEKLTTLVDETALERQRALFRGDVVAYSILCEKAGIEPEFPDVYEMGFIERENEFMATLAGKSPKQRKPLKKHRKINYETFGRLRGENGSIDSEDIFAQTEAKRSIIIASGNRHLYGPGGIIYSTAEAPNEVIGKAYRKITQCYHRYLEREKTLASR